MKVKYKEITENEKNSTYIENKRITEATENFNKGNYLMAIKDFRLLALRDSVKALYLIGLSNYRQAKKMEISGNFFSSKKFYEKALDNFYMALCEAKQFNCNRCMDILINIGVIYIELDYKKTLKNFLKSSTTMNRVFCLKVFMKITGSLNNWTLIKSNITGI